MDVYVLWSTQIPCILAVADDPELLNMAMARYTPDQQKHLRIWNGDLLTTGR